MSFGCSRSSAETASRMVNEFGFSSARPESNRYEPDNRITTPSLSTLTLTSGDWATPSTTAWILLSRRETVGTWESLIRLSTGGDGGAAAASPIDVAA